MEQWFEYLDKSKLVNAHLVEPLLANNSSLVYSRPFILSAYGTNNKYTSIDVFRKWMYMYNECKRRDITIVGFSTDCDPPYLKAMQLSLGFFIQAPNIDLLSGNNNLLKISIASHWNFFLSDQFNHIFVWKMVYILLQKSEMVYYQKQQLYL